MPSGLQGVNFAHGLPSPALVVRNLMEQEFSAG